MLIDVCLFDATEIKRNPDKQEEYCFPVYDVETGLLWYTACCSTEMYQTKFAQLEKRPHHLFFTARLVDVPMLMDIVGPVPEATQRLDLVDFRVLSSNVHVPQGFLNRATPTIVPYTFEPGPKAGYYVVKMTGEARFVPTTEQQEMQDIPIDDDDIDFGPDDFEEVMQPTLSVFDSDQARRSAQSSTTTSVALKALQKRLRKPTTSQTSKPEQSVKPSQSSASTSQTSKPPVQSVKPSQSSASTSQTSKPVQPV